MKYKNILVVPFYSKKNNDIITTILLSTLVIGTAATYYLINKNRQKNNSKAEPSRLGNVINDVRSHIKITTEQLLGETKKRHDPSKITIPSAGTTNWKCKQEPTKFPHIPDPSIRIN